MVSMETFGNKALLTLAFILEVIKLVFYQFKVSLFKDVIVQVLLLQLAFSIPIELILANSPKLFNLIANGLEIFTSCFYLILL